MQVVTIEVRRTPRAGCQSESAAAGDRPSGGLHPPILPSPRHHPPRCDRSGHTAPLPARPALRRQKASRHGSPRHPAAGAETARASGCRDRASTASWISTNSIAERPRSTGSGDEGPWRSSPSAPAQLSQQLEQLGMGGRRAGVTEILRCGSQPGSEMVLPDSVGQHASQQGGRSCTGPGEPPRQRQPPTG